MQKASTLLSLLIHPCKCSMPARTLLPGSCAQLDELLHHCCTDTMNVAMLCSSCNANSHNRCQLCASSGLPQVEILHMANRSVVLLHCCQASLHNQLCWSGSFPLLTIFHGPERDGWDTSLPLGLISGT